jgi:hypothetical protein
MTKTEGVKLTDNQHEVLINLGGMEDGWWRPMDFGGHDASHHSGTAARLVKRGLVERTDQFTGSLSGARKTWLYRITELGRQALAKDPT